MSQSNEHDVLTPTFSLNTDEPFEKALSDSLRDFIPTTWLKDEQKLSPPSLPLSFPPHRLPVSSLVLAVCFLRSFSDQRACSQATCSEHRSTSNYRKAERKDDITPLLKNLHWLPVRSRIVLKSLLLTYKILKGQSPTYLTVTSFINCYKPCN